ncbi:glycosyltransferase [Janthinobacterium sp. BJB446]|nr:glycosyltransferase [Janthinobacterium sp. BJB446]
MITTDMDANSSAAAPLSQEVTQAINAALDMAQQHLRDNELDLAAQLFLAVLELAPQEPFANRQLGLLWMRVGDAAAAVPCFAVVLAAQPDQSTSWLDYIEALILSGQHETAQQMLALGRKHGLDSLDADRLQQALLLGMNGIPDGAAMQPTPASTPSESDQQPNAHMNVLFDQQRYAELEREARALTRRKANDGVAWKMLGLALLMQGQLRSALPCIQKAIRLLPRDVEVQNNMGLVLQELGRLGPAELSYRRAITMMPEFFSAHSNLLMLQSYSATSATGRHLAEARRYGKAVASSASKPFESWSCRRDAVRLRIGIVSGDLRKHPVGYFLESMLASLNTRRVELIAYPTVIKVDDLTDRIAPHFSAWRPIVNKTDEEAAKMIEADGVHVLLDLSGHTADNRLPLFAWRPAPVQTTWLGYFATTGVQQMDYLLGDRFVAPLEESGAFTETLWHMPDSYLCFTPPDFDISVSPLPALENGFVTFACFNKLNKMNDGVVAVWARILHAVPGSRLFLRALQMGDAAVRSRTIARFSSCGIGADRLRLEGALPRDELLAAYQQADIVLDPFPYPGGTTSMEALWMGLPIVTRCGKSFLSHLGESVLHNAGLPDWVAADDEEYVAIAARKAGDLAQLAALRAGLRAQVLASPLYDAPRFARHFEDAMWGMWQARMAVIDNAGEQ